MYFLVGTNPEKSKFQLSFKYRLFNPEKSISQKHPWISGIHLCYTQTSLWDLESDSRPFVDTSYKPELFFLSDPIKLRPAWLSDLTIQAGFRHESNGKDKDASRSTNYAYLKTILLFRQAGDYCFALAPRIWVHYNNDDNTNPDLKSYRGYFELEGAVVRLENFALMLRLRKASKGHRFQVDVSYPLDQIFSNNLDFYAYGQYFNGYAETLKNYNEKAEAIRFGIAITR